MSNPTKRFLRELGRRVRRERTLRGWRQEDLAKRLRWSRARVARVETGRDKLPAEDLRRLAEALEVGLGYLVTEEEHPLRGLLRSPEPPMEQVDLVELASQGLAGRLVHTEADPTTKLLDMVEALVSCPGDSASREFMKGWLEKRKNGG